MESIVKQIEDLYNASFYSSFSGRYFNTKHLDGFISSNNFKFKEIGQSFFLQPIKITSIGNGTKKVLIWSQMHGNESTGTKAILDVLLFLTASSEISNTILTKLKIDFIPILNPDSAQLYSRIHPSGIDMNRDFSIKALPETQLLVNTIKEENYTVLFNLHDQRTIFGTENNQPATLSFLAPSEDFERTITPNRKKAMGVISYLNDNLQMLINGKVGRYSDEFYPTASGDNFSKMGFPCILFEAGHFPNDYQREITRKYNAIAIILGLYFIATENDLSINYEGYFNIPENNSKFLDIIYRNISIENALHPIDIGIQLEEKLNPITSEVQFIAKIYEIGDLSKKIGHTEFNSDKRVFNSINNKYPIIGMEADFLLGEDWIIKNGNKI